MKKGVLIIETVLNKDIGQELPILKELLKMLEVLREEPFYVDGQTQKKKFLEKLFKNDYRFIHISAHGGKGKLLIHGERETPITSEDIKRFLEKFKIKNPLKNKFLTISACGEISASFIKMLHEITKVTAVIYPLTSVSFSDAALFMIMFYYSLFKHPAMKERLQTPDRIAHFIDGFQKAKYSFLQLGGVGCFRLDYWWNNEHVYIF